MTLRTELPHMGPPPPPRRPPPTFSRNLFGCLGALAGKIILVLIVVSVLDCRSEQHRAEKEAERAQREAERAETSRTAVVSSAARERTTRLSCDRDSATAATGTRRILYTRQ